MSFEESYVDSQEEQENFPLSIFSRAAIRLTRPRIQLVLVFLNLEVNQSGRETEHSTSSSAEDRTVYCHISILPLISMSRTATPLVTPIQLIFSLAINHDHLLNTTKVCATFVLRLSVRRGRMLFTIQFTLFMVSLPC